MGKTTPEVRNIIIKRLNDGHSQRSIARFLSIPRSTVQSIYYKYKKTGSILDMKKQEDQWKQRKEKGEN